MQRLCDECHFDVNAVQRHDIGPVLRATAAAWAKVLDCDPEDLRRRPRPDMWSPLEYACHVRDVYQLYSERLELMLTEDGPHYPNWDQDVTAVAERYDLADPSLVASQVTERGGRLAARFDAVCAHDWARTGFRSDGAAFTVESFGRYLIHDPVHHLADVGVSFAWPP